MHTATTQPDPAALAFLHGIDVQEVVPEVIEPDTVDDDGGPVIH